MNCLVLTPHRYGIREVAERIGEEWEAMGHRVDYRLARGDAARVGPVTVGTPGIAVWWYRQLKRAANEEYDLVWTHQPLAPVLPTRDLSFWNRVVVTFHTTMYGEYVLGRNGIYPPTRRAFHWFTKTLEDRFYRALEGLDADGPKYTVVSPHLREEIATFGIEQATYIPNGVFTPEENAYDSIRGEHGIPEDATLVFNVGSLTPQKRAGEFAKNMRAVTDQAEDIYCVMAGKGPLQDTVESHTSERVRWLGYVDDAEKWRWFHDADVFVSLSAYEGMPVASLEALSAGVPVVLSDIPAHRNVVENHDTTGVLVDMTPESIVAGIRQVDGTSPHVSLPEWEDVAATYLDLVRDRQQAGF